MPEHEAQVRAFYDHETDEPRATGRRRRQVADWGVGEDVFDRMPSRRFARADRHDHDSAIAARDDLGRRNEPATTRPRRRPAADWLAEVSPRPADEPGPEDEASRTAVIGGAADDEIAPAGEGADAESAAARGDTDRPADARPRRTIVIGGHPDRLSAPRPRRPPRTALERVGASPDRLAAYAVGLGLLLILIAVLTTSH